jgi:hypothetical protein
MLKKMPVSLLPLCLCLVAFVVVMISCDGSTGPDNGGGKTSLIITAGNNQIGAAGIRLISPPLTVRAVDKDGLAIENITVSFTQISKDDGGGPTQQTQTTDGSGYASTFYDLDTLVGVDTIMAIGSGLDDSTVFFNVTVIPAAADSIRSNLGSSVIGIAGQNIPCTLQVTDRYSNGIANARLQLVTNKRSVVTVDSTALDAFATDTAFTRTNTNGYAFADWLTNIDPSGTASYPSTVELRIDHIVSGTFREIGAVLAQPSPLRYYYDIRPILADNCFICHSGDISVPAYKVDLYWRANDGVNLIPGDPSSPLVLNAVNSSFAGGHLADSINTVETDKIKYWVAHNAAQPGQSGLNNYTDQMKSIIDSHCAATCHSTVTADGNYVMSSHAAIRGNGSDGTPNAIPGDSASLLVQKLLPGGNMRVNAGSDALADSLIRWLVVDSLREY